MAVVKNRPHLIISCMQHIGFIFSPNYLLITKSFYYTLGIKLVELLVATICNHLQITYVVCSIIQVGALSVKVKGKIVPVLN
jgi:hypothetical protein